MITFRKYDADETQIMDDGTVVASALRMNGGRWALFDAEGHRLAIENTFATSAEAARAFHPAAKPHSGSALLR